MQKTLKKYWPVFIVPTLIAFAIAFILPFVIGIYLTFCKFTKIVKLHFQQDKISYIHLDSQDYLQ